MEIEEYNVIIEGINLFDQPIKNDLKTYVKVRKFATGQDEDYTNGYLLDYPFFKKYYKLIAIDLSKQQKLDANPKAMQKINCTESLSRAEDATIFFIIEDAKETALDFPKGAVKVLLFYFDLI